MPKVRQIRPYLRAAAFLTLAALVFHLLSLALITLNWSVGNGYWGMIGYSNLRDMKDIPKNHIDVAVFGSSHVQQGVLPMPIFEEL